MRFASTLPLPITLVLFALLIAPGVAAQDLTLESPNATEPGGFGESVAAAGDIDGDGISDVVVGARDEDVGGDTDGGRAYVMSGADGSTIHTLTSPNTDEHGNFGQSVAPAGDVDGDGTPDVAVGAPGEDDGATGAGRAYVLSGSDGSTIHTLASPNPSHLGYFGQSVAPAGDINGDGTPDLLVGARTEAGGAPMAGRAYVVSGADGSTIHTLTSPNAEEDAQFGWAVAPAGDVNHDGVPDIAVGARREDGGGEDAGRAYLISGADGSVISAFTSPSPVENGHFGYAVAPAGDVNGDGTPDLLIGTPNEDGGADESGQAYVMSGADGSVMHTLETPNPEFNGQFGTSIALAGDVHSDGTADAVVGAPDEDGGFGGAGRAYVIDLDSAAPTTAGVFTSPNAESNGHFGTSVAPAGDVDHDGVPDAVVGAPNEEAGGDLEAGRAYVLSGVDGSAVHTLTSPNSEFLGRFGTSVAPAGDVDGDGTPDLLVGADGEAVGGTNGVGRAYVLSGINGSIIHALTSPNPEQSGLFGSSVAPANDIDGDGTPDLLIAAPEEDGGAQDAGRVYVLSGSDGSVIHALTSPNPEGLFGTSVAPAGDVDGDGTPDLLVGAFVEDGGADGAGRAYVLSGSDGSAIHTLTSPNAELNGSFGIAVAPAGDINGDGTRDILIGAEQEDGGANGAGRAYVLSGSDGSTIHELTSPNAESDGQFGISVAPVGDVDHDGTPDLLVGTRDESGGANGAGRAYVLSGSDGSTIHELTSPNAESSGIFGISVAPAGDVTAHGIARVVALFAPILPPNPIAGRGDGTPDFLIGALDEDSGADDAGRAYVISGADGSPVPIEEEAAPTASALSAPYPNPATASVRLNLTVSERQRVVVEAFDVLGRRVGVLHEGPVSPGTPVTLRLETEGLPSGVYLVRVRGEALSQTRRLTVVR